MWPLDCTTADELSKEWLSNGEAQFDQLDKGHQFIKKYISDIILLFMRFLFDVIYQQLVALPFLFFMSDS